MFEKVNPATSPPFAREIVHNVEPPATLGTISESLPLPPDKTSKLTNEPDTPPTLTPVAPIVNDSLVPLSPCSRSLPPPPVTTSNVCNVKPYAVTVPFELTPN